MGRKRDESEVMWPIYSLLKYEKIDYGALERDFTWTVVGCDGFPSMFKLLHVVKPTEGIRSLKISGYGEKTEVHIMSKIDFDTLVTTIEDAIGRDYTKEHYSIRPMELNNTKKTPKRVLFQLMLNSLGNNSLVDASNAEGSFFKVVKSEETDDLKNFIARYITLEFKVSDSPDYLHCYSDLSLDYNVATFNNAIRDKIRWGKKDPKVYTRFRYVKGAGMQTVSVREDDGTTFVRRSCRFDDKVHLKMLDYTRSATVSDSENDDKLVEKNLEESRAKIIMDVVNKFNSVFGEYLGGVSLYKAEAKRRKTSLDESYEERLMDHFRGKPIRVYNLTGNKDNSAAIKEFIELVRERYKVNMEYVTGPSLVGYNIPVILPKKAYKGREKEDPHTDDSYNLLQHVVIHNLKEAIKKYKSEVKKNRTIFDKAKDKWLNEVEGRKEEDYPKTGPTPANMPLAEVLFEQLYVKEEVENGKMEFFRWAEENYEGIWEFAMPLYHSEKRKVLYDGYAVFGIDPDGRMSEPKKFALNDPFGPKGYSQIEWKNVEYAVKDPSGQINVVRKTGITTIPDADAIYSLLRANHANHKGRTVGMKDGDAKFEMFGGSIDIGYAELARDRWIYYVGQMNMKMTVANSSMVREIEALDGGNVFFDRLFHMMSIPYVKHKQNSVIPFPIKYLTEWCKKLHYFTPDIEEEDDEDTDGDAESC